MDKVLIFAMQEGMGGIEKYVLNLSLYSSNQQHKYGYIILGTKTIYENELNNLGVDYFFITHKDVSITKNIYETNKLFKEQRKNYDVIYFNTSGLYYPIPYLLAKMYGYQIIIHSHSAGTNDLKKYIHYFNRSWINLFTNKKLACSTPAGKWMFARNNFTVVPNAIDIDKFVYNKINRQQIRNKLGIREDEVIFGNIGRLTYVKNQSFILQVLKELQNLQFDAKVIIIGEGEDLEILKAESNNLLISDKVIFYGRTDSPEQLMSAVDCIIMPSIVEGFPITLVEAQASGLPCVVSDSITTEVNISGRIEFVSLDRSATDWARHVIQMNLKRYDCILLLKSNGYDVHDIEERVSGLLRENE